MLLSEYRLRLGPYSTACKLVDRKKTNTELNKLKASRTHMTFSLGFVETRIVELISSPPHTGEYCDVT